MLWIFSRRCLAIVWILICLLVFKSIKDRYLIQPNGQVKEMEEEVELRGKLLEVGELKEMAAISDANEVNEEKNNELNKIEIPEERENESLDNTFSRSHELDGTHAIWDKSYLYKIRSFAIVANSWSNLTDWTVCLSSQCSADLLFWAAVQSRTWTGPMSIAVFVPDVEYIIATIMIKYMRNCFPHVKDRISFHMVYPSDTPPKFTQTKVPEFDCYRPEKFNFELVNLIRNDRRKGKIEEAGYPQNLMRNIARQGCPTEYCYTPDIDMLSAPDISKKINNFLAKPEVKICQKCAFILPTYEIAIQSERYPLNKQDLILFLKHKQAQRFHIRVYKNNQANSNLLKWEKVPMTQNNTLSIAYNITSWKYYWEPIYITKCNVPSFDERFIGYGFTRNSQVYEMHIAGYSWHMFDNAFLLHRGFQTNKAYSRKRWNEINSNRKKFYIFVREIHARYGVQELVKKNTSNCTSSNN